MVEVPSSRASRRTVSAPGPSAAKTRAAASSSPARPVAGLTAGITPLWYVIPNEGGRHGPGEPPDRRPVGLSRSGGDLSGDAGVLPAGVPGAGQAQPPDPQGEEGPARRAAGPRGLRLRPVPTPCRLPPVLA